MAAEQGGRLGGSRGAGLLGRLAGAIPLLLIVAGTPAVLQAPVNPYDGGLVLTLSRFTSLSTLPYRDLWTLYGPGPPIYGSVIMQLFGRGTLPQRLGFLAVQAGLLVAVYLVARRYVGRWASVVIALPIATFAVSEFQFHFTWSLLLVLFGVWFVLRSAEDLEHRTRRAAIGAFLMGLSFWGRYEFAPIGVGLVFLTWWWLRPSLAQGGRWVLLAGLTPPVVFGAYLLGVVGPERAWFNLVEHPLRYYPRSYCRGTLPPVWGSAFRALFVPFQGRLWTTGEFLLAFGSFGPPLVGGAALVTGSLRWRRRDPRSLAMVAVGSVALFVWIELRVRAGLEPEPVWAPLMVSAAMLVSLLRSARARTVATAVPAALIILTIATSWAPAKLHSWTRWPNYDPVYGFADLSETFLFDRAKMDDLTEVVHRHAGPDAPVFVALTRNTGHFANMSVFYWLVDRRPGSRFIAFEPCLTDRIAVQREIVQELADTDVVIETPYFLAEPPPLGPPSTVLDDYLADEFETVHTDTVYNRDDIVVLVRRGAGSGAPP